MLPALPTFRYVLLANLKTQVALKMWKFRYRTKTKKMYGWMPICSWNGLHINDLHINTHLFLKWKIPKKYRKRKQCTTIFGQHSIPSFDRNFECDKWWFQSKICLSQCNFSSLTYGPECDRNIKNNIRTGINATLILNDKNDKETFLSLYKKKLNWRTVATC